MKLTSKLKTISIKCNPPRYTRRELLDGTNAGLEPRYHVGVEGIGTSLKDSAESRRRYAKNFQKSHGLCRGCKYFNPKIKKVGGHCRLKEQDNCIR